MGALERDEEYNIRLRLRLRLRLKFRGKYRLEVGGKVFKRKKLILKS